MCERIWTCSMTVEKTFPLTFKRTSTPPVTSNCVFILKQTKWRGGRAEIGNCSVSSGLSERAAIAFPSHRKGDICTNILCTAEVQPGAWKLLEFSGTGWQLPAKTRPFPQLNGQLYHVESRDFPCHYNNTNSNTCETTPLGKQFFFGILNDLFQNVHSCIFLIWAMSPLEQECSVRVSHTYFIFRNEDICLWQCHYFTVW